jgi:RES domain-containing protein
VQRVFRVCRSLYARLDGEGARRVGGRWNSPGRAVVYMADSISLAVLENLVHLNREDFPVGYVVIGAVLPSQLPILSLEDRAGTGELVSSQTLGDRWLEEQPSAVLRVPSAIVPQEFIYLLNPKHPDFARIVVELPVPFTFDERLFR